MKIISGMTEGDYKPYDETSHSMEVFGELLTLFMKMLHEISPCLQDTPEKMQDVLSIRYGNVRYRNMPLMGIIISINLDNMPRDESLEWIRKLIPDIANPDPNGDYNIPLAMIPPDGCMLEKVDPDKDVGKWLFDVAGLIGSTAVTSHLDGNNKNWN